MKNWKQSKRAMDSLGQGFSDPPLINPPAVLSTNTCRHFCHWICPWQARWFLGQQFCCFPRPGCCPFSPVALSIQDFPSGLQNDCLCLVPAPHPQQRWRYQSNTPSAWEAYHYQLRRYRSSGNFNQQRHFHIQRDIDIINSLKWAPEEMSYSSWDSSFLHRVWNKMFCEMQRCCADPQLLMPWFSATDVLRKSNFSEGFSFPWGTCCLFLSLLWKALFMMATWKSCTRTQ